MSPATKQFVDEDVTRKKFAEELASFHSARDSYRKLGVLMLENQYPNVYFGFIAPALKPLPMIFAVKINFINYDVEPLSITFVHPLTLAPVPGKEVGTRFLRKIEGSPNPQALLVPEPEDEPFFCIPGIREYHEHTFHTGDPWFLYRQNAGEGSLLFLLDNLQLYGTSSITSFLANVAFNVEFSALGIQYHNLPL